MPQATEPTYLGDGVYASFDGYQIWLKTDRHFREHTVALDPEVYLALTMFVATMRGEQPAPTETPDAE